MDYTNHAKSMKILFCTIIFTILCTITIWAGNWEPLESGGYKYKNDDGTYFTNTWLQDNEKWYFFDENGLLVVNETVEGYQLGADGAEISGVKAITSQYAQVIVPTAAQQSTVAQSAAAQQSTVAQSTETQQSAASQHATAAQKTVQESTAAAATTVTYVLNKNTKKFHKPSCSSVSDMAAKNRRDSGSSREEIIAQGYTPCKRCKP